MIDLPGLVEGTIVDISGIHGRELQPYRIGNVITITLTGEITSLSKRGGMINANTLKVTTKPESVEQAAEMAETELRVVDRIQPHVG